MGGGLLGFGCKATAAGWAWGAGGEGQGGADGGKRSHGATLYLLPLNAAASLSHCVYCVLRG